MVNNGIASRPGCVFCNGNHDIVLEPEEPVIGGIGGLPPAYLSIRGHEDCLDLYSPSPVSTAYCLPSTKPSNCLPPAWTELQQKFDGENCPAEKVIGLGAPEYLSIPGHEDCLGTYNPSPSFEANCLPSTKPSKCLPPSWTEIQQKFDGEKCPISGDISTIEDHHLCLKQVQDAVENQKCLTLTPDSNCPDHIHSQILNLVFSKPKVKTLSNAIVFPKNGNSGTVLISSIILHDRFGLIKVGLLSIMLTRLINYI